MLIQDYLRYFKFIQGNSTLLQVLLSMVIQGITRYFKVHQCIYKGISCKCFKVQLQLYRISYQSEPYLSNVACVNAFSHLSTFSYINTFPNLNTFTYLNRLSHLNTFSHLYTLLPHRNVISFQFVMRQLFGLLVSNVQF